MNAQNTPPADDVRETLAHAIDSEYNAFDPFGEGTVPDGNALASVILAAFEVRPHGPVTDAEVKAAQQSLLSDHGWLRDSIVRAALKAAREARS